MAGQNIKIILDLKGRLIVFFISALFLSACSKEIVKTDYQNKNLLFLKEDRVALFPTSVIKDIETGAKELGMVYDHVVFSLFKEKGFSMMGYGELQSFLKKTKLEILDSKLMDYRELSKEALDKLQEAGVRYYLKMLLIVQPRENILDKQNIFILLKLYNTAGDEMRVMNLEYEGEETVSSLKILNTVKERLSDWIDYEEKLIKKLRS